MKLRRSSMSKRVMYKSTISTSALTKSDRKERRGKPTQVLAKHCTFASSPTLLSLTSRSFQPSASPMPTPTMPVMLPKYAWPLYYYYHYWLWLRNSPSHCYLSVQYWWYRHCHCHYHCWRFAVVLVWRGIYGEWSTRSQRRRRHIQRTRPQSSSRFDANYAVVLEPSLAKQQSKIQQINRKCLDFPDCWLVKSWKVTITNQCQWND